MTVTRIERGWVGHFFLGHQCRYHRNTLLTKGDRTIVVSSVGSLPDSIRGERLDTIGHNRYYETMAFRGIMDGSYIEAEVNKGELSFEPPWSICAESVDELPDDADAQMDRQHEAVVSWIAERFEACWASASEEVIEHQEAPPCTAT